MLVRYFELPITWLIGDAGNFDTPTRISKNYSLPKEQAPGVSEIGGRAI
jgi:hypothetical protein